MAIDQAAIERTAEISALRILAQTTALLTFKSAGFTSETVRDLGRSMVEEIVNIRVEGSTKEYEQAVIEANHAAIVKLFNAVADALGHDGKAVYEFTP